MKNTMENQIVRDFMIAYIAETVRLEMNGTAHRVANENGLRNPDFGKLVVAYPQVQTDFMNGVQTEPTEPELKWPWPGKTGTEIVKAIDEQNNA